ncbi:YdcH family protein [Altererythrobacter sp. CAU 1778]
MQTSHVSALQSKHAGLEARIREEQNRPMPDETQIQILKKRKLLIKQELAQA